jgi:hypothetical protein
MRGTVVVCRGCLLVSKSETAPVQRSRRHRFHDEHGIPAWSLLLLLGTMQADLGCQMLFI